MLSFKDFLVVNYTPGMPELISLQAKKRKRDGDTTGPIATGEEAEEPTKEMPKKPEGEFDASEEKDTKKAAKKEIKEALRLAAGQPVEHDASSAEFAKHYVKGHKGEHSLGAPAEKHERDSEQFHNTYHSSHTRTGYGGSGTSVYTHKQTGDKFEVTRRANGQGFHGTTHSIRKI